MPQFTLANFNRFILDTENDADSPDNEELMQQYMYNLVGLLILMLDTGISGTATADPTNVANSVFVDAAAVWTDNLHNGRTLLITSGTGKGLFYLINDTDDAANSLTLNDNLFADGVRNGDGYKILYDLKTNLDGHDHDGVNSRSAVLTNGKVMLPPWDMEEGTEYTTVGAGWETFITGKIYVPVDANLIAGTVRLRSPIGPNPCEARFRVDALTSNVVSTANAAYTWVPGLSLDVSTLSGWQDFYIDVRDLDSGGKMKGYAFAWTNP